MAAVHVQMWREARTVVLVVVAAVPHMIHKRVGEGLVVVAAVPHMDAGVVARLVGALEVPAMELAPLEGLVVVVVVPEPLPARTGEQVL